MFDTCCTTVGMYLPTATSHPSNGNIEVVNRGSVDAVLGQATTGGGDGALSVRSAWVVPMLDGTEFGGGFQVPDGEGGFDDPVRSRKWEQRVPLEGYRLGAGETVNILVVYDTASLCGGSADWLGLSFTTGDSGAGSASTDVGAVVEPRNGRSRSAGEPDECAAGEV
jgi:hypothetical protein